MGTNVIIRNGFVAALGVAGLTLSACASSGSASDRYGSVYDYESGSECADARYGCDAGVAMPAPAPVYPVPAAAGPVNGVVYADCSQIGHMDCGYGAPAPAPMPTPTYTEPAYTGSTYSTPPGGLSGPVECPAGTTDNGDGTCMQGSSYGSSSTYSGTSSTYSGSTYSGGEMADCPAGTTDNGDGTCMESGSSYSSGTGYTSGTSYTSTTASTGPIICPAGTLMQPDGTCMESGYSTSSTYTTTDYLPIRK